MHSLLISCYTQEMYGYSTSTVGSVITWILIILTLGFLRLVFYWKPDWMIKATHRRCDIRDATKVLLLDKYAQWFVEEVCILNSSSGDSQDDLDSLNQSKNSAKHRQPVSRYTLCFVLTLLNLLHIRITILLLLCFIKINFFLDFFVLN